MTPTATAPRLRLVPPPPHDPPYDDEPGAPLPQVRGSLALAFPSPSETALPLRLVPPATGGHQPAADGIRDPLPDPRVWSRRLAQAVMEVVAGIRTPAQLSAFATLRVLDHLELVTTLLHRRHRYDAPAQRPLVRAVQVCEPQPGVAEACAVIEHGERRRALALRLEAHQGRWQCTALRLG